MALCVRTKKSAYCAADLLTAARHAVIFLCTMNLTLNSVTSNNSPCYFDSQGIGHDAKMEEMMSMKENSYLSAIAVGSIRIIGSILGKTIFATRYLLTVTTVNSLSGAIFLKKQISRRVLMTCSAIGMFLSMSSLAAIEQIMEQFLSHSTSSTLLVVSSSSFILSHAIGFNVIPMLMVGELCPVNLKSLTSGTMPRKNMNLPYSIRMY